MKHTFWLPAYCQPLAGPFLQSIIDDVSNPFTRYELDVSDGDVLKVTLTFNPNYLPYHFFNLGLQVGHFRHECSQ